MISGLELFEARDRTNPLDLKALEEKYEIKLPPVFRSFLKNFKWNAAVIEDQEFWFTNALGLGEINFRCQTAEQHFRFTYEMGDRYIEDRGLVLLAACRYGVYVGTKGEEIDKIIMGTESTESNYMIVADDIFEFLRFITTDVGAFANSVAEYVMFLKDLGYDEDEIEHEIDYWKEHYN